MISWSPGVVGHEDVGQVLSLRLIVVGVVAERRGLFCMETEYGHETQNEQKTEVLKCVEASQTHFFVFKNV